MNISCSNETTLESRIDVGQGINVRPGKFRIKNKYRALTDKNLIYLSLKKSDHKQTAQNLSWKKQNNKTSKYL